MADQMCVNTASCADTFLLRNTAQSTGIDE